jgi:hypothetical protein
MFFGIRQGLKRCFVAFRVRQRLPIQVCGTDTRRFEQRDGVTLHEYRTVNSGRDARRSWVLEYIIGIVSRYGVFGVSDWPERQTMYNK